MKQTVYFTTPYKNLDAIEFCINETNKKKQLFIDDNIERIGQIDREDLKILTAGTQNNLVIVVIQLTYYTKEK